MTYALGFYFSEDSKKVLLINKMRPENQKGLLNGIGGLMIEGETIMQTMVRESIEEIGVDVPDWDNFFKLRADSTTEIYCFRAFGDLSKAETMTDERIKVIGINNLFFFPCIRNRLVIHLDWLIPFALKRNFSMGKAY